MQFLSSTAAGSATEADSSAAPGELTSDQVPYSQGAGAAPSALCVSPTPPADAGHAPPSNSGVPPSPLGRQPAEGAPSVPPATVDGGLAPACGHVGISSAGSSTPAAGSHAPPPPSTAAAPEAVPPPSTHPTTRLQHGIHKPK
jgi:hypothetical protein